MNNVIWWWKLSGGSQVQRVDPYAPAEPALIKLYQKLGNLYGQGVKAAGYVAPSQQTITVLAGQEPMGTAAQQQLADTLSQIFKSFFITNATKCRSRYCNSY